MRTQVIAEVPSTTPFLRLNLLCICRSAGHMYAWIQAT